MTQFFDNMPLFNNMNMRVVGTFEDPLIVAKDVGRILNMTIDDMLKFLDDGTMITTLVDGVMTDVLTESGLYHVMFMSDDQIALAFRKWMFKQLKTHTNPEYISNGIHGIYPICKSVY